MAYILRNLERKNYKEIANIQLPRARRVTGNPRTADELYPIEVVEDDYNGRVKVHYIGYGEEFDEWKQEDEVFQQPQGELYLEIMWPSP